MDHPSVPLDLVSDDPPLEADRHGHNAPLEDCLEFVNTGRLVRGRPTHEFVGPPDAIEWFAARQLIHDDARRRLLTRYAADPAAGHADLEIVRRVRDALRGLLEAAVDGRPASRSDLRTVNRTLRTHYVYVLVPAADGVSLGHRHLGDPIAGALGRLAETLARELSQGMPERLRICESPDCSEAFIDRSRTGRRRWCDMSTCGNRAKAARHREKRRLLTAAASAGIVDPTA
ncbi:MAG: CGNR zinc finger domain-containing protein [Chloroflexi bacterium]|jgi:predicted RNA-binding Zn ribbon-like protein|nr:CGNR zinc finger domain-containing protein [Chloroflexota bacterium]